MQFNCMISTMIKRENIMERVRIGLSRSPVVALIGPRQCGKTTMARQLMETGAAGYFDLEDPASAMVLESPMSALLPLRGLVVIDEAQRAPGLFPVLRVLADREGQPATFLILGSASPELSRQASESLAGRVEILEMGGFALLEIGDGNRQRLWQRGGFPRSFLAGTDADSMDWRRNFTRTFLERDLAGLGFGMSPQAMGRFWTMLAHYHGQLWNGNEIATSMGISPNTARHYLDALEQTFMIRRLLPWHANVGKRLVKTPKIYFRDSGIFHALQGIGSHAELLCHPKLGASWEGFALEQVLRAHPGEDAYFYAIHSGSELDLFFPRLGKGIEIKFQDAPKPSRSMRIAMEDLKLKELQIIYPGSRSIHFADGIRAVPLTKAGLLKDGE
jgi:predicted AAA+ superfamily ATPase